MSIKHRIARNMKALIVGHWTIEHHIQVVFKDYRGCQKI